MAQPGPWRDRNDGPVPWGHDEPAGTRHPGDRGYAGQDDADQGYVGRGYTDQGYGGQGYGHQGYGHQGYGGQGYDEPFQQEPEPATRRGRRRSRMRHRAEAREQRWQRNRLAVPYRTDGPKVTFGILWVVALLVAAYNSSLLVTVLVALAAGLAGLQTGYAWFPEFSQTRWWTALAAMVAASGGFLGPIGVVAGMVLAVAVLLVYLVANPVHRRSTAELLDALFRASLPAGIAAACLGALAAHEVGAVVALVALVSAYEAGDFLVGSGSSNAVEGPVSGLLALSAVLFILWVVAPSPFTPRSIVLFGALAGVCGPSGQLLASALLPRGSAWAPALRRLDSYLLSAPLWLVLLINAPTSTAL
ncbi:MAG: hypothetical protein ACFCVK_21530 [Acidimicrobiales bacterium]